MAEEIETVKEHCKHKDCYYRMALASGYKTEICAYALMEYKARRCAISQCDKYKPRGNKKRVSDAFK